MAALGSLVVKLALEHAQYTQALGKSEQDALAAAKRIQDAVDGMQARVASTVGAIAGTIAAGLSINAFKNLISGAIEGGAALNDLAIQANTTVEALSGLASIGKYSDVGADAIVSSMNKLTKNLSSATEESKGTGRAVQALGLNLEAFRALKPEEQMMTVAHAMGEFKDGASKSAIAMDLYGKEGAKLLPFLKDLADVSDLQAKVTTEQAAAADNLSDNWTRLTTSGDAWKKTLANAMIPALDIAVQSVLELVNGTGGLKAQVKALADDGSIRQWTLDAVTGVSYVVDVVEVAWRAFKSLGLSMGSVAAAIVALANGNARGALAALAAGGEDINATWSNQTMGAKFRARLEELNAIGASAKEAKKALDYKPTETGTGKAAAESEYDKLIKRIQERINASQAEIEVGRQLTEGEKFRVKVLSDMDAAGIKLTETEREALKVLLARTAVLDRDVQAAKLRTQTEQNAAEQAAQSEKERAEYAARTMQLWQQRTVAANEAIQSASDSNELVQYEATLLGQTTQARQTLVEVRRVELELAKKLREIDQMELEDYQKDALKDKAREWAEISKSIVKNRAALSETDRILSSVDSTAQQVWTNIWEGGSNVFVKLSQTLKASLLDMLYQLVLRPWVINIAANILGSLGINGSGGAGLISMGSNALGLTGVGSAAGTAALATTQSWFGMSGTAAQTGSAMMQGYGAGTLSGAASTVGAYLPYIAAAYAAYKILSSLDGGETRTGGQYAVAYDGTVNNNRRGESYQYVGQQYNRDNSLNADGSRTRVTNGDAYLIEADGMGAAEKATRAAVAGTAAGIDATLKALGSSARLTGFWAGLETSGNGRGGVFAGGSLSNGKFFGESGEGDNYAGTLYEKWSTNSPDAATASANFALDLKQSYIQALQSVTDVPEWVKKKLKDVTAESLSSDDADALIKLINDQITAVNSLGAMADALPLKNLKDLSFDAASGIMELVGGLDNLTSLVSNYYSLFYSEEERKAQTKANITKTLTDAGLDVPKTREEFRALVDAQDLNTEAGRKNYAVLMNLASAFASVTDSAEDLKAAADKKAADDKAAAEKAKADAITARNDAMNAAYSSLEKAVDAQKSALSTQREAVSSLKDELQGVFDLLDGSIRDLLNSVTSTTAQSAAQARHFISQALQTALTTGALPDQAELSNAISTVKGQIDSSVYATAAERDYQRMVLAAQLSALKDVSGTQLSTAEKTLAGIDEQIAQLDKTLAYWKEQIEIAQGTHEATLSVADAIQALTDAITGKDSGSSGSSGGSGSSGSTGASPAFVVGGGGSGSRPTSGASPAFVVGGGSKGTTFNTSDPAKATTLAGYYGAVYGWSADDFKSWASNPLNKSEAERQAAELGIPLLSRGTNYVARAGLAYLHEREAVVPAPYNPAAGGAGVGGSSGSADSSALLAEVAALREEARLSREAMQTVRTLLNDVTEGGNMMRSKAV